MDIHEIVVVLKVFSFEMEGGVMVAETVDPNPEFGFQRCVGTFVLAEVPEINIPAWPMHRHWIVQAQAIPLQHHHPDAVPRIDRRKMADGRSVHGIPLFERLKHSKQPQLLYRLVHIHRHHPRLEQPRIPVPCNRCHSLRCGQFLHRRPIDFGGCRGKRCIGMNAEADELKQES